MVIQTGGPVATALVALARWGISCGAFAEASLAVCKAAKEAGVQVIMDADSLREGMLDLARVSDYFLASETFAKALVGDDRPLWEMGTP